MRNDLAKVSLLAFSWQGDLLSDSSSAFQATAAAIVETFSCLKEMVSTEVSVVSEKILKQESLTSENKNDLQKLIVSIRSYLSLVKQLYSLNEEIF